MSDSARETLGKLPVQYSAAPTSRPRTSQPNAKSVVNGAITAPHILYRVEDESSRARYIDDTGIFAEDTDTDVNFTAKTNTLLHLIAQHLDWRNREATPFISMYSDEDVAWREAERRVRTGKQDVRIYKIDTYACEERTEYRNIRLLAKKLGLYIHEEAWNNSMHEYIFLHFVPESAIEGWEEL
ncbi:uncharacterized protein SETTUDRAFT_42465 [Exserohilum turcica Et28A]|uniref:DUF7587 domain-containing protein n=1 Tax=Exserohilum turcicum (strain 28A) TaxID=671987 RepID=R0IKI9_EXST2|nr:uncharacterized protein SETTUDRAFT_42465 [Exserohilum turcica Et28A]EOA85396.1 hypothetical protein SETTUDRAFT_42465 [Exserohilum turcica Et28A]